MRASLRSTLCFAALCGATASQEKPVGVAFRNGDSTCTLAYDGSTLYAPCPVAVHTPDGGKIDDIGDTVKTLISRVDQMEATFTAAISEINSKLAAESNTNVAQTAVISSNVARHNAHAAAIAQNTADIDTVSKMEGPKGETGAKGEAGEDHSDCNGANMIRIPTQWDHFQSDGVTTRSCSASTTDGSNYCFLAFDGNPDTEWVASQLMQGTHITINLGEDGETTKYRVLKTLFTYRDAMSDRTGSVTVKGNSNDATQVIASGTAQTRTANWGPHSEIIGNQITLTASGGNPWMDGQSFGIKEVEFFGCPVIDV